MKEVSPDLASSCERYAWSSLTHSHAQQSANFRCFLGLSLATFIVLLASLYWNASAWLVVPLGFAWGAISLCGWAAHREAEGRICRSRAALQFLDEQHFPLQAKESAPHALRRMAPAHGDARSLLRHMPSGVAAIYWLIALTSLYLGSLSLLRGKLPGWEIARPAASTSPAVSAQESDRRPPITPPQMPAYGNRPIGSLPGGAQRPPAFPRSFTPPPNGTTLHGPGFTPPPRPFTTRPFPGAPGNPVAPGNPAGPAKFTLPITPPPFSPPAASPPSSAPSAAPPAGPPPPAGTPAKPTNPTSAPGK